MVAQRLDGVEQLIEEPLAAQVARNAQMAPHARVDTNDLGELHDEAWGQIVDAEITHVLKHVHGLRAAGTGHAGDDDDIGDAVGVLGRDGIWALGHDGPFIWIEALANHWYEYIPSYGGKRKHRVSAEAQTR